MFLRILLTAIFLFAIQYIYAQEDEYSDVVELKDGNRVVGMITENKPGEQVTIKSRIGTIFTFKADQIKNIIENKKSVVKQAYKPGDEIKTDIQPAIVPKDSSAIKIVPKTESATVRQQKKEQPVYRQQDEYMYATPETLNLRLNVEVGYSYRMAKVGDNISSEFQDYVNKLKSGFNIAANVSYFFSEEYGICLDYTRFMTSNSMSGVSIYYPYPLDTTIGPGIMEDNISISYFGIGLAGRKIFSDGDILLIGNFSLGIASYNNDAKLIDDSYKIDGSTFAYTGFLSLDFMLSRNWALGIGISYLGGTLKDAKVNDESANLGEENLFRLDFNAGVKFYY